MQRYIIYYPETLNIDLNSKQDDTEFKLTFLNPAHVYLFDEVDKRRQHAKIQIIEKIDVPDVINELPPVEPEKPSKEATQMLIFNKMCEENRILHIEDKINYFINVQENHLFNKKIGLTKKTLEKNKNTFSKPQLMVKASGQTGRLGFHMDVMQRVETDLRYKFKIDQEKLDEGKERLEAFADKLKENVKDYEGEYKKLVLI